MNEIVNLLRDPGPTTVGTLFAFMGFYLILNAQRRDIEELKSQLNSGHFRMKISNSGPGVVFALFGAALVIIQYPIALIILMHLVAIFGGVGFAYMGFLLFREGVLEASDVEAVFGDLKILLRRAAPGTIFALFGVSIVIFSLYKLPPVGELQQETKQLLNKAMQSDRPKLAPLASADR